MKFSTRISYGMRALLELAINYGSTPMQIKAIAEREQISSKYLEQLIGLLKVGGLVVSIRGPKGGYVLARPPEEIRLTEVFTVLDGHAERLDCPEHKDYVPRCGDCLMRSLWSKMQGAMDNLLGAITLKDAVEDISLSQKSNKTHTTKEVGKSRQKKKHV